MSIPAAPTGKTLEAIRLAARARFFLAAMFLGGGAVLFALAKLLLASVQVGSFTGLILATILLVLGLAESGYSAMSLSRSFPLSEFAAAARGTNLFALLLVPLAALAATGWALVALPRSPIVLVPSLPLFWAPPSAFAAIGLLAAARELASERMAVLAAAGAGFALSAAVFSSVWSIADPAGVLEDPRYSAQLLLISTGFFLQAIAFSQDAWIARAGRRP